MIVFYNFLLNLLEQNLFYIGKVTTDTSTENDWKEVVSCKHFYLRYPLYVVGKYQGSDWRIFSKGFKKPLKVDSQRHSCN